MTLIATGDLLRGRSLQGLQYMSEEEAEREALRQAMAQQEKAQRAALAGQVGGIGASYALTKYGDRIGESTRNLLGLGGGAQPLGVQAGLAETNAALANIGVGAPPPPSVTLGGITTPISTSPINLGASSSALPGVGATKTGAEITSGLAKTNAALAKAGVGKAATSTAAVNVGGTTTALTATPGVVGATAPPAAGAAPALSTIAAPLAIGLGAFFLLSKLFD